MLFLELRLVQRKNRGIGIKKNSVDISTEFFYAFSFSSFYSHFENPQFLQVKHPSL